MPRTSRPAGPLLLVATLALAACATVQVSQDYDTAADFTRYRTYRWLEAQPNPTGNPRIDSPFVASRIRVAVERTLAATGYDPATDTPEDFSVGYHISLERRLDVETLDRFYGYRWSPRYRRVAESETRVTEYAEGTLVIDIVDRASGNLVWRGFGRSRLRERSSPEESARVIDDAVERILAGFPPGP